ncbi:MAG: family phosphoesterase [Phycisphaerales bacterium]|nr:family phosphoesterase [Phycisphaerales bacterium]
MTAFVESCVQTLAGSAVAAERHTRGRPRARKLLAALAGKRNILVTTHIHPDPDALGSAVALTHLLARRLIIPAGAPADDRPAVTLAVKGRIGGGINDTFLQTAHGALTAWDAVDPASFDAVVLLDTQPQFSFSPLPAGVLPTAVIDHHQGGGKKPRVPCWDVRPEVGATCSIVFSYFMELEEPIPPDLAAGMLYAIESDLAGAAGTPGDLDNIALSSLTLTADPRQLYQMRFTPLPQAYYRAYSQALANAEFQGYAVISHLDSIDSMEQPAVMADFLLRFDQAQWALVTATLSDRLVLSLRTRDAACGAAEVMQRILARIGEGGGHRTKAGGHIPFAGRPSLDIAALRRKVWRRFLLAVGIKPDRPTKLVG